MAKTIAILVLALAVGSVAALIGWNAGQQIFTDPVYPLSVLAGLFVVIGAMLVSNLRGTEKEVRAGGQARAEALTFAPPDNRARIYFVRTGFPAKAAGMNLLVDGVPAAQIRSPRFTCVDVAPGSHVIDAHFVGGAGAQNTPATATVPCAPGSVTILHLAVVMGGLKSKIVIAPWSREKAKSELPNFTMVSPKHA